MNVSYHLAQYTRIIADLRSEIKRLHAKIDQQSQEPQKEEKADIREIQGVLIVLQSLGTVAGKLYWNKLFYYLAVIHSLSELCTSV